MNDFIANLKREAESNPLIALGVAAGLITAIGKLIDANTQSKNARSWDRETKRRDMKDARNK